MNIELIKKEKNEVTLKVNVSNKKFEECIQKSYNKQKGKFNIPGFRKGKAPKQIIEAQYGREVFYDEAINMVFPEVFAKAIDEHKLEPVGRPEITDINEIVKGNGLTMTLLVAVKPEIKVGEYKGIKVDKVEYTVSEDDINAKIEAMRDQNARFIQVDDRAAKENDMLLIDFKGSVDGKVFQGGEAENYNLVLGSKTFIPGFEEQLVGKNIGENVKVEVKFPKDYHSENLAGKDAIFQVVIKEIKVKELPALDDEFAKDVSEFDTLEELKNDVKTKIEESNDSKGKAEIRNKVIDKVIDDCEVDIPNAMIEAQLDNMIREFSYQLQYQGLNLEEYLKYTGSSMDILKEQMKEEAVRRIKSSLALEEIAKIENIEVSDEDIEQEVDKMAKMYKMEAEKFKTTLKEEDMNYFKDNILVTKTVDLLVDNAEIA